MKPCNCQKEFDHSEHNNRDIYDDAIFMKYGHFSDCSLFSEIAQKIDEAEKIINKSLALDVDYEKARSIHRVVRAMNDGECPRCHKLDPSRIGMKYDYIYCGLCEYTIPKKIFDKAMTMFAAVMEKNFQIFENWRKEEEAKEEV
jgi:hypothetical protein